MDAMAAPSGRAGSIMMILSSLRVLQGRDNPVNKYILLNFNWVPTKPSAPLNDAKQSPRCR